MSHFIEHIPHNPMTAGPGLGLTLSGDGEGRPLRPLEALGLRVRMIVIPRKTFVRMEVITHVDSEPRRAHQNVVMIED